MLSTILSLTASLILDAASLAPIGAAIAIFTAIGAGIAMGIMTGKAVDAIARQPEASNKIRTALILGLAFAEMTSLLAFLISIFIITNG